MGKFSTKQPSQGTGSIPFAKTQGFKKTISVDPMGRASLNLSEVTATDKDAETSGKTLNSTLAMLDAAADHLNTKGLIGPVGGKVAGVRQAITGYPVIGQYGLSKEDNIARGLLTGSSKTLAYSVARKIMGEKGPLQANDIKNAAALSPDPDKDTYDVVKAKTALIRKFMNSDFESPDQARIFLENQISGLTEKPQGKMENGQNTSLNPQIAEAAKDLKSKGYSNGQIKQLINKKGLNPKDYGY